MFVDKRLNKNGSITFRVTYNDDAGKRKRLPSKDHPKFKTVQEAQIWVKSQDAYHQAKRAKMAKKMEWKTKFYNFEALETAFYEWHKKRAPNSWQNDRLYMVYVFDFFLNKKQQGNVNMWNLFFQEFKDWLESDAKGTKKNSPKTISYSTANHVIRTINNFQEFLVLYNHMDPEVKVTLECFPQHLVGKRTWEDVIQKDEFAQVHKALCATNQDVADFFYVAYWTGMRFSEIRGLPMGYLYSGELSGPIGEELKKHGIKSHGYIVLESQIASKNIERDKNFTVDRKPLKTKRKISPENARTIPIMDKECWNVLARRYKQQKHLFDATQYGTKRDNYLLFDEIPMSRLTTTLRETYEKLNMKPKSFHCCRHSRATYLVGETRSYFLGKAILGHKSDVFDDYVHTYEMIALKAKQNDQEIEELE